MARTRSHSVPGQAAGYLFQPERALFWLAKSPAGAMVGIETDDDVAVRLRDGTIFREQDKHAVSGRIPFGDGSKDLWNTLDIWASDAIAGKIDLRRDRLFLTTNARLPDCVAKQLGLTTLDDETELCLDALFAAGAAAPPSVTALVDRVLSVDREILRRLVLAIECIDETARAAGPDLRRDIASLLHIADDLPIGEILDGLSGWLHQVTLEKWRAGQSAWISRDAFDRHYHLLVERNRRYKRLGFPRHLVNFSKDERGKYTGSAYVKQLRLVRADGDEVLEAIDDFICCSIERFRLAADGELSADDLRAFEDELLGRWHLVSRRELRLGSARAPEDTGYAILTSTLGETAPLGSEPPQPYLAKGTFHRLADDLSVGWHPDYRKHLAP